MQDSKKKKNYLAVNYDSKDKPFTKYPYLLTNHLASKYGLQRGQKILDLGCGRGEFLAGFIKLGLHGFGVDMSCEAKGFCNDAEIKECDFENEKLPYEDESFDIVFSKSVLEHFYYPEKVVHEIFRILKPGGTAITMVPDWELDCRGFYADFTHRTPFSLLSLKKIFKMYGFAEVKTERLRQLPLLWKMPWLIPLSIIIANITPSDLRFYSKIVKYSKEIMLLCSARKPRSLT